MIQAKLAELRAEFEKGQGYLRMLDLKRAEARDTLLRISGAIQALEELVALNPQAERASVAGD